MSKGRGLVVGVGYIGRFFGFVFGDLGGIGYRELDLGFFVFF